MTTSSNFDSQFAELSRKDRLGTMEGDSIQTTPPPLKYYAGSILCVIASAIMLGIFGILLLREEPIGDGAFTLLVLGILFGILGGIVLVRRSFYRYRLQGYKNGFSAKTGGKERFVLFDEITFATISEKEKLNNGVPFGVDRRLLVQSPHQKLSLRQVSVNTEEDLFGQFAYWILSRGADAAETRIKNGESIRGKGWGMDAAGLHDGKRLPVALSEITEAGIFEKKTSFWRRHEELPFFSVDANSKNARLLLEIVRRHLPETPPDRKTSDSLGRLLFRKKTGLALLIIAGLLGISAFAGGLYMLFGPDKELLLGVIFVAIGAPLCGYTILEMSRVYQFHELGVAERSLLGSNSLRYANIERIKYEATRHYHNGVYTGTSVRLRMIPGENGVPIKFSGSLRGTDEDLERLREFISALVAEKMYQRLSAEKNVAWGKSTNLSKTGVHFVSKPLFGSGKPGDALFSNDLTYKIDNGVFSLFRAGEKKAAMTLLCSEENFYPGFLLMSRLAAEAEQNH